jgi:hypothetical protein
MDWLADIGSVVAACGAVGAAAAATILVRITQKQNDLAQREFFSGFRPIVIPTWPLDLAQGTNAQKYVDLTTTQTVRIKNIGPGVALNLSLVLFGPPPDPPSGLLPNRVMAWLEPPLASGEERPLSLPVGQSNFNGDVYVANDPNLALFAPPHPSKQDFMIGSADMFVARMTITYHDVFERKHSSTYDFDVLGRWFSRGYQEDIPQDLWDLEGLRGRNAWTRNAYRQASPGQAPWAHFWFRHFALKGAPMIRATSATC